MMFGIPPDLDLFQDYEKEIEGTDSVACSYFPDANPSFYWKEIKWSVVQHHKSCFVQ